MRSITTKQTVVCDVTILLGCYGPYNRLIQAWADTGLIEGLVKEKDTQGLQIGHHKDVRVVIETFFSGQRLVSKIVKEAV